MKNKTALDDSDDLDKFDLSAFFPYQVRVFYTQVTSAVADVYQANQDISAAEWRCFAILSARAELTAADIVLSSSMDKVSVSRAISRMREKSWIIETKNRQDGRSKLIKLSPSGIAVLQDLLPKALDVEQQLLAGISDERLAMFFETMGKITQNRARISALGSDAQG